MTNLLSWPRLPFPWSLRALPVLLVLVGILQLACAAPSALPGNPTQTFSAQEAPAPVVPNDPVPTAAEQALSRAESLRESEKYADALAAAREARDLAHQAGESAVEVKALFEVGKNLASLDNLAEASQTLVESADLARKIGDARGEAMALQRRGLLLNRKSQTDAIRDLETAIAIWERLDDAQEMGRSLYTLGKIELDLGHYAKAMSHFERALPLARKAQDRSYESTILNGMASVQLELGESDQALQRFNQALALAEDPGDIASAVNNLAKLHRRRGEFKEALKLYQRSLEINQESGEPQRVAFVRTHLGGIYWDLGQPEEALRQYNQALESLGDDPRWRAITLASIGQVYLTLGDAPAALKFFEQALEMSHRVKTPDERNKTEGRVLHGLGMTRLALGQTAEAIKAFEEALARRRMAGDPVGEATTLLKLGTAYQAHGDLEQAASHLRAAEERARSLEARFAQAEALLGLARLTRERGELQGALAQIEECLRVLEAARSNVVGDELRSSFFATRRSYYEFYVDLLVRLDERHPRQGYAAQAFAASELARARSLLDLLAEGRLDLTRGIDPDLKRQEREITARLSEIQAFLMEQHNNPAPNAERIATLTQRLESTEVERKQLEQKIINENPLYAQVRYPKPLKLSDVQKHLDTETALLEYFLGTEGSYLFAVTRDGLLVHRLPDQAAIEREVEEIRKRLRRVETETFRAYTRQAYQLYQTLVAPAGSLIAGKRRLLIAADGGLQLLPFEALLTARSNRPAAELPYLLRDFSINYIPSASVLSWLGKPKSSPPEGERALRLVAFADPVYGVEEGEGTQLQRLEGTEREVAEIESLYPKDEVLVYRREQASEQNVLAGPASRAQRLYFATHGHFDEKRPEYSGLWLTRTEGSDDGLLRVYEIFDLDLNADLVVLSACETGLGKQVTGEGLVGITRAFLYAGAPSVVVSLWPVSDTSTPVLMPEFNRVLDETGDKAEALRRAKLGMIEKKRFAHPTHWAPFILIGRTDSVSPVAP